MTRAVGPGNLLNLMTLNEIYCDETGGIRTTGRETWLDGYMDLGLGEKEPRFIVL